MAKKKQKSKMGYNQGGLLPNEIGALLPLLNMAVPGLGTVASGVNGLAGQIAPSTFNPVKENTNPFGMNYGGVLPKTGDIKLGNMGFQVKDSSGKTDGKNYGVVNLDDNEVVASGYVFSDDLGFAKEAKKVIKALADNDKQPNDFIKAKTESMLQDQKKNLMLQNEMVRLSKPKSGKGMQQGGPIDINNPAGFEMGTLPYSTDPLYQVLGMDYLNYPTPPQEPFNNRFQQQDLGPDMGPVMNPELLPSSTPENMTDADIEAEYARQTGVDPSTSTRPSSRKSSTSSLTAHGYDVPANLVGDNDKETKANIKARQKELKDAGTYKGNVDGIWGRLSEAANRYDLGPVSPITPGTDLERGEYSGLVESINQGPTPLPTTETSTEDSATDKGRFLSQDKIGNILQGVEVGSKLLDALRPAEREQTRQMKQRQIDTAPLLRRSSETMNAALSGANTFRPGSRNALLSNLYAQKLNQDASMMSQVANQNRSLAAQTDQFNIGQQNYTADINARNRAAQHAARTAAFTSLGNTGRALNQQYTNRMGAAFLNEAYQEVSPFFWDDVNKRLKSGVNG